MLFLITLIGCKQREVVEEKSGNPLFEGWYADPEITTIDNKYWIFPTYSAKFEEQVFLDAFSSEDLVNWKKHKNIIDTTRIKWAKKALWAPCVVEKDNRYFLFFAANDIQTPESKWWNPAIHQEGQLGGIGIGVATSPEGPYTDYLQKPLINEVYNGAQPIDQFVFKDIDEQYYIIYGGWGHCNIGKLNEDFTALSSFEDGEVVKEITPEGYVEGPVIFLRSGWYYFMWSEGNWTNGSYKVAYGKSKSLFGPFQKIGTVLESDPAVATGAGHHSVLNIPNTDDWYIIYHRRPIPNEDRDHRVTCIDRMHFDEKGFIQPIKMTFEGVKSRVLQ
ncbi:MAG: glycoside hydrolase family 43 protein [Bacteroidota bacterium]